MFLQNQPPSNPKRVSRYSIHFKKWKFKWGKLSLSPFWNIYQESHSMLNCKALFITMEVFSLKCIYLYSLLCSFKNKKQNTFDFPNSILIETEFFFFLMWHIQACFSLKDAHWFCLLIEDGLMAAQKKSHLVLWLGYCAVGFKIIHAAKDKNRRLSLKGLERIKRALQPARLSATVIRVFGLKWPEDLSGVKEKRQLRG